MAQGGAEELLIRLVTTQSDLSHLVISLESKNDFIERLISYPRIKVINLGFSKSALGNFLSTIRLCNILFKYKPDVVQTWMYKSNIVGGIAAKFFTRSPISWSIHNSSTEYPKLRTKIILSLSALLSKIIPDKIIFCSNASLETHTAIGFPRSKSVLIYNGTPLDIYTPSQDVRSEIRSQLGIKENEILFGMVARCDPIKGHGLLLQALSLLAATRKHPTIKCLLVGKSILESSWLADLVHTSKLGDSLILEDDRIGVPRLLNAMDFYCLTSYTEAFPLALCEAMASSVPAISTNVGDCSFIIGHTGWVVPPNDVEQFALAMSNAIDDVHLQSRKQSSRERISQYFSLEACFCAYKASWLGLSSR
mgnify:CR=1 FL=1